MDGTYHYMLMSNHLLLKKKLLAALKDTGLTMGQPKVLDYLGEHNGASQKEIAAGCHIEAGSLTSVLNRMEENGLVQRRTLNGNRRSYFVFLTEEGEKLYKVVQEAFTDLEKEAFCGISEEERKQFMKTFLQIYKNVEEKSSDLMKGADKKWKN